GGAGGGGRSGPCASPGGEPRGGGPPGEGPKGGGGFLPEFWGGGETGIPDRCTRDRQKHPAADPSMRVFHAGIATILTLTVLGATCPGALARPVHRLTHSSGVVDYWPRFSPDGTTALFSHALLHRAASRTARGGGGRFRPDSRHRRGCNGPMGGGVQGQPPVGAWLKSRGGADPGCDFLLSWRPEKW